MAYIPKWTKFSLSRSDSYAQYNFSFTVIGTDYSPSVIGHCRDEDGNEYETETGILLSSDTLWILRQLNLEKLPDAVKADDPIMLDGSKVTCSITLENGFVRNIQVSAELSFKIYQLLLPCFINNPS